MLNEPGLVWGPAVYDGISARLANSIGFPILISSGAGTAAARIGQADFGLATASEQAESARHIQAVSDAPVLADADNGFGSLLNVVRTVHEFERAGVGGILLEDQLFPKRCGHIAGKAVVDRSEFKRRLSAAVGERSNPDFVIVARTDARDPLGLDEALARVEDAFEAGVDVAFVEAPRSLDEIHRIAGEAPGPMVINVVSRGVTPTLTVDEATELGFKIATYPGTCMFVAAKAIQEALIQLKEHGVNAPDSGMSPAEFFDALGMQEGLALDAKYAEKDAVVG
jgi:2-methylisocitrate lyase-like PEP mutase family enzyme